MPQRTLNLTRLDRMGCVMGGIALLAWGMRRHSMAGGGAIGLGACLLYQAYTGDNPLFRTLGIRVNARPGEPGAKETIVVADQVAVARSPDELYRFWRALDTWQHVAPRVREARPLDERRSRWVVEGPHGMPIEWESEITWDQTGREIGWRTTHRGALTHFGRVNFAALPGDRGTMVRVHLEYVPPAGSLGTAVGRITGQSPRRLVRDTLRRMKQLLETGEIATTEGQPTGAARSSLAGHFERRQAGTA